MLRDRIGRFASANKTKFAWIGKRIAVGLLVAFIGSLVLEMGIKSAGEYVADQYTQGFVSFQ